MLSQECELIFLCAHVVKNETPLKADAFVVLMLEFKVGHCT